METGKIFGIVQLALCAVAYVLAAVLCAAHIVRGNVGNVASPFGWAFCLGLLLALRWLTLKSWEQLKAIDN